MSGMCFIYFAGMIFGVWCNLIVLSLDARLESLALQVDFELWRVLLLDVAPRFRNALERADSSVSAVSNSKPVNLGGLRFGLLH